MNSSPKDSSKTSARLLGHAVFSRGITSATISSKAKINPRRSLSINVPGSSQHRGREVPTANVTYSRSRASLDETPRSARRISNPPLGPLSRSTATSTAKESRKDVDKDKTITWSAISETLPAFDVLPSSLSGPPPSQLESYATELYLLLSTLQLRLAAREISISVQELIHQVEKESIKLEAAIGINYQDEQLENKRALWEALTKRKFAHRFIPLLHELSILSASAESFINTSSQELGDDGNRDERKSLAQSEDLQNAFKKIWMNLEGLTSSLDLPEQNPQVLRNLLKIYTLSIIEKIDRLKLLDREIRRARQERRQVVWEKSREISRTK